MKYFIAVLLSATFVALTAHKAPALTKTAVHEAIANEPTVKTATPAKAVQPQPENAVKVIQPKPQPMEPLTHVQLMAAAGIPPKDYGAADYIISHESDWDPNATEPTSGAHGLPQALPYSKTGCGWSDSICQLRWANAYADARYGGWWQAQAYWSVHRDW